MAWVFLFALLFCVAAVYIAIGVVDRRIDRELHAMQPDGWSRYTGDYFDHFEVPFPVSTVPVPYDWEATGDFD